MIYQHPHISLSAVGQASIMDKSRVTRSVESLVSSGLIVRETNPEDKRASVLDLTPEGHEIYAKVSKLAMRVQRRFLNSLTAEELKFFDTMQIKFDSALNQLEAENEANDQDTGL